jgi:long-chain fatty acid transport protein
MTAVGSVRRSHDGTPSLATFIRGCLAATALCAVGMAIAPVTVSASGYGVGQESVSAMGVANAGGAAAATDASTVFFNPAGMTKIQGNMLTFGAAAIFPYVDYDEGRSRLFDGTRVTGGEGGDGGQEAVVPHFYGIYTRDNGIKLGLGVNSPFGLVTDYDARWLGRYSEVTTSLKTFNVNPSIAANLGNGVSVGGGINLQYSKGTLLQAIDFGSNCVAALGAGACAGFGLTAGRSDGSGRVEGDAYGYGFNLGILYELSPETRFGAHFRSKMILNFDGQADFGTNNSIRSFLSAAGSPNAFQRADAEFTLTEPEMVSLSAYHALNDKWAIMGDVTWTRWGQFDKLEIDFNDTTPTNMLLTDWENVFRLSTGATYRWSDELTLRSGIAYDDSPIKTPFRGPGIPDSDRIVLAIGAGYKLSDSLWLDVAYQHFFFKTGHTDRISATNSVLNGDFKVTVDAFGAGLTMTW